MEADPPLDARREAAIEPAPTEQAFTITTLKQWEEWVDMADRGVVLLQCGSPSCVRCPAFTERIRVLQTQFQFFHVYVNTHEVEEDLLEELQVTQLPAYVLVSGVPPMAQAQSQGSQGSQARYLTSKQAASPDQLAAAVAAVCPPTLVLDAEF